MTLYLLPLVPKIHKVQNGKIRIPNNSKEPILISKNAHVCNILPQVDIDYMSDKSANSASVKKTSPQATSDKSSHPKSIKKSSPYSTSVQVDPDNLLSESDKSSFRSLVTRYDEVFNPEISHYNNKSGPVYVEVNMGPEPPPQHKGRVPFYGRDNMHELQEKFDVLAKKGVFKRPQEVGVTVEVINPSFLVKKKSSDDKRLVTDFGSISGYCRPTPTLMPDVDTTLRKIDDNQD